MAIGFPTKANWAAGDVLTASAMDDLAGTVNLLSNASAASGSQLISNAAGTSFAYQPTPSASNPILNSAFQVWQRGTSVAQATNGYGYTADRWVLWAQGLNNNCTTSRQVTNDTTNLPFIQYCARFQRNSGQTGTTGVYAAQFMETVNSIPFAGKNVTFSFYARAGANFSSSSNALTVYLIGGTGTDQNQFASYTGQTTPVNTTATLTTTWQRFTYTGNVAATVTELTTEFGYSPTGTAGANDYFEITGVQIDIGSVALPFRTYAATIQGELAACQRYLPVFAPGNLFGFASAVNQSLVNVPFLVQPRVAPTGATISSTTGWLLYNGSLASGATTGGAAFNSASLSQGQISVGTTTGSPTLVAGQSVILATLTTTILWTGCEL